MAELCRLILNVNRAGLTDVIGPLHDKGLCREMLAAAEKVIGSAPAHGFQPNKSGPGSHMIITYDQSGRVDVGAPLPNREFCGRMIKAARTVLERYNDETAPAEFGGTVVN